MVTNWYRFDESAPPLPGKYLIWDACLPDPSAPLLWTFRPVKLGERWSGLGKLAWFNESNWPADRAPSHYTPLTIPADALATQPAAGEPVATLRLMRSLGGPSVKVLRFDADQLPHGTLVDVYAAPPAAAHGDDARQAERYCANREWSARMLGKIGALPAAAHEDAEVAIKQGRHLASAAEWYMKAVSDAFDLEETNLHREVLGDSRTGLASAVCEFRKRADAAMRAQGDGEAKA